MPVVRDKYRGTKRYALAYSALIAAAHSRNMCTYTGIAYLTGLPTVRMAMASQVGHLVGEISEDEHKAGRPMLSALVVEKDTGLAGGGFFTLARNLKALTGTSKADEDRFLKREKTKLFEFWK